MMMMHDNVDGVGVDIGGVRMMTAKVLVVKFIVFIGMPPFFYNGTDTLSTRFFQV